MGCEGEGLSAPIWVEAKFGLLARKMLYLALATSHYLWSPYDKLCLFYFSSPHSSQELLTPSTNSAALKVLTAKLNEYIALFTC